MSRNDEEHLLSSPANARRLYAALESAHRGTGKPMDMDSIRAQVEEQRGANVVVRLSVVRPDAEYMAERLKRLLAVWDPYMGWTSVLGVDILSGEAPIPPEYLTEAMKNLPPERKELVSLRISRTQTDHRFEVHPGGSAPEGMRSMGFVLQGDRWVDADGVQIMVGGESEFILNVAMHGRANPLPTQEMPTAKPEWTHERPDEPGFYWWHEQGETPIVVELLRRGYGVEWCWFKAGNEVEVYDRHTDAKGSLWWPVRLDPPPVG